MKRRLTLLAILTLSLLILLPAEAGKRKTKGDGSTDLALTTVTSVDLAHSRITLTIIDNKQAIIYQIPLGTALTINGEPAQLSQIKSGMYVVSYTEADAGTLSQLDVSKIKPAK